MVNSFSQWQTPRLFPTLQKKQLHIWRTKLDCSNNPITNFLTLLDRDEQIRAQQFRFEKDRQSFIISHGVLRQILSKYLNIMPEQLNYSYLEFGKPYLKNYSHLQFNLSHSHNIALIAVILDSAVGIDIEYMQRKVDADAIAERFFSKREYAILQSLNGDEKIQAFFNAWTRKEAFLKAHGQGLSYSLENIEVSLQVNQPAKFLAIHDATENIADWCLHAISMPNYVAAVAIKGHTEKIELFLAE